MEDGFGVLLSEEAVIFLFCDYMIQPEQGLQATYHLRNPCSMMGVRRWDTAQEIDYRRIQCHGLPSAFPAEDLLSLQ